MLIRTLAVASLVVAAACADDGSNDGDPSQDNEFTNPADTDPPPGDSPPPEGLVLNTRRLQCQADGPCSPACSGAMVVELHVPSKQCFVFACSLDTGGPDVGGCHP